MIYENTVTDVTGMRRDEIFALIGKNVERFFKKTGPDNGLTFREGQYEMARDVVRAAYEKKPLIVEAGVGIGKSYAYLVPAVYINLYFERPVIIATSTITLQEQLEKDAEDVMRMTGIQRELITAKGQGNYLCLDRLEQQRRTSDKFGPVGKADAGLIDSEKQDRAEYGGAVSDFMWNKVRINGFNFRACRDRCLHSEQCRYLQMRTAMMYTKGIVICNQDLLAASFINTAAGKQEIINSDAGLVIVDEAHNLEDRIRTRLTDSLSMAQIDRFYDDLKRSDIYDEAMHLHAEKLLQAAKEAFGRFELQCITQDARAEKEGTDTVRYYVENDCPPVVKMSVEMNSLLALMNRSFIDKYYHFGFRNQGQTQDLMDRGEGLRGFLNVAAMHQDCPDLFWTERSGKEKEVITLYRTPKNVARRMRELFFNGSIPFILTSATLSAGLADGKNGGYAYLRKSIGFDEKGLLAEPKPSPYDFGKNTLLYYTKNLPHPSHRRTEYLDKAAEEIRSLLSVTEGRTLILFTAKTDMEDIFRRLKDMHLPYPILMQKEGSSKKAALERFGREEHSVLLGTGPLWEGINVVGSSLSQVIIFRLPFAVRDPLADYKYLTAKDGMMDVAVPEMILKLKQGIGRLIRSETDRGIISILDSRVSEGYTAQYYRAVWNSLSMYPRTSDLEEVKRFWKQQEGGKE